MSKHAKVVQCYCANASTLLLTVSFYRWHKRESFHVIVQNVFEALKVLVEEADVYIGSDKRLRLPVPHLLEGVELRSDRDGVTYVGVVFQYSNVMSENDFYRLWANYMKALGSGNII